MNTLIRFDSSDLETNHNLISLAARLMMLFIRFLITVVVPHHRASISQEKTTIYIYIYYVLVYDHRYAEFDA